MASGGMWARFKAQSSHQINVLLEICVLFFNCFCFLFVYVTDLVLIVPTTLGFTTMSGLFFLPESKKTSKLGQVMALNCICKVLYMSTCVCLVVTTLPYKLQPTRDPLCGIRLCSHHTQPNSKTLQGCAAVAQRGAVTLN